MSRFLNIDSIPDFNVFPIERKFLHDDNDDDDNDDNDDDDDIDDNDDNDDDDVLVS